MKLTSDKEISKLSMEPSGKKREQQFGRLRFIWGRPSKRWIDDSVPIAEKQWMRKIGKHGSN